MAVTVRTSTPDHKGITTFSFGNGVCYHILPSQIMHVADKNNEVIATFRNWDSVIVTD